MKDLKFPGVLSQIFYTNIDPRRRQEVKDSRMIQEDRTAMANLPIKPIHREYNQEAFFRTNPFDFMFDDEIG